MISAVHVMHPLPVRPIDVETDASTPASSVAVRQPGHRMHPLPVRPELGEFADPLLGARIIRAVEQAGVMDPLPWIDPRV